MATSADLHKAVVAAWNASNLNSIFRAYWVSTTPAEFVALHDEMAGPGQPFPYCVFRQSEGATSVKMTGHGQDKTGRLEVRDVPWEFVVHARAFGSIKSAKTVAAELVEEILKVFGGHPEVAADDLVLDHGWCLQTTYKTDWPMRDGEQIFAWHIRYEFKLDVPVAN